MFDGNLTEIQEEMIALIEQDDRIQEENDFPKSFSSDEMRNEYQKLYLPISEKRKERYEENIREHAHYKTLKKYFANNYLDGFDSEKGEVDNLLACGYLRKHESFQSEKEVRIVT